MPAFTITQATLDHLDQATQLFVAYRQFYECPPKPVESRVYLQARLQNSEATIFLAILAGEAVGFMQLYPTFASLDLAKSWVLYDLFVAPSVRKMGIGAALLKRAHQLAMDTGASGLLLQTAVDNMPAQQLYEKLGWQRETEFYTYNLVT